MLILQRKFYEIIKTKEKSIPVTRPWRPIGL
jgi:hypothetical protein